MTIQVQVPDEVMERLNGLESVAAKIRFLDEQGYSVGEIARILNIRYQWAYNVLHARPVERHRVKISITIDPELLNAVDAFLEEHPELDRSKIIDDALRLWCAREQERAMEAQFAAPRSATEQEERRRWRQVRAAAAKRIFRPR